MDAEYSASALSDGFMSNKDCDKVFQKVSVNLSRNLERIMKNAVFNCTLEMQKSLVKMLNRQPMFSAPVDLLLKAHEDNHLAREE